MFTLIENFCNKRGFGIRSCIECYAVESKNDIDAKAKAISLVKDNKIEPVEKDCSLIAIAFEQEDSIVPSLMAKMEAYREKMALEVESKSEKITEDI